MSRNVAVVIGMGGIGSAIASLLTDTEQLLIADARPEVLARVADQLRNAGLAVETMHLDVADRASVRRLAERAEHLGIVNGLAHTAGLSPSQAEARDIFRVDLVGTALVIEEFAEVMGAGGAAVVIASSAGHLYAPIVLAEGQQQVLLHTPAEDLLDLDFVRAVLDDVEDDFARRSLAYGLSKRANQLQVRQAAVGWGANSVRINSISPGVIDTPMTAEEMAHPQMGGMVHDLAQGSPAGRLGHADDIAKAARFLLTDDSAFISGTDLLVDGGLVAQVQHVKPAEPKVTTAPGG
jgi:NAD(P)-dependent dehydrogenase (short-subunit alcohol dehydrogenase family)